MTLRQDANVIIKKSIEAVMPEAAVRRALDGKTFAEGRIIVVAAGKAAWNMSKAAYDVLGKKIDKGIVITKHGQSCGAIGNFVICEAGHPVPDDDTFSSTLKALEITEGLSADDTVIFLLSGGGSALFEKPVISGEELQGITSQMLASGADIVEMNTIRKRLSMVKGGLFAQHCAPAHIFSIVLSDILGDPLDMIASGPAYPDTSTCEQAAEIVKKYGFKFSEEAMQALKVETPKKLDNVETMITGSVRELCKAAADACRELGYEPTILTDMLNCEASDAGRELAAIANEKKNTSKSIAIIEGGETVVHLKGHGLGGRNQELALSAAEGIDGLRDTCIFSVGSDGTDGPTDAAGGYVDGDTVSAFRAAGKDIRAYLEDNDAYHGLQVSDGLIITGGTGTNVNDVAVLLIKK